jgi:hypothetical protein
VDTTWRAIIWSQFGAAIDMLENGLVACPDELWSDRSRQPEFWYVVYHALFWLDLYLTGSVEEFAPPAPFGLEELDPAGVLPDRVYSKHELKAYLEHGRDKCRATIEALTGEKAQQLCQFSWLDMSFGELLLYNMRHIQDHAGELHLILGQTTGSAPGWVKKAKSENTGK